MARSLRIVGLVCVVALLSPVPALAQGLSDFLINAIVADIRLEPPTQAGLTNHQAHFVGGITVFEAPGLFNQQIVSQLATFPIGSPTGGFAFTFDSASGTFERATNSFGPAFADRALTNGRKKVTIGANFQYSKYTSFEGRKLDSGDITFYLTHASVGGTFVEGDVIKTALKLKLSSATTTVFANYGVTDAFDVAVAVPMVRVSMDATVDATILRLATGADNTSIHTFPGGRASQTFVESGEATGIGDLLVRAKYRFASRTGGGLAAGVDLKLPTGDEQDLLGTGSVGATFSLIGSTTRGKLGPHFNVGFTATGDSDVVSLSNELNYKIGTELIASPTVTLSADIIGRSLLDAGRLQLTDVVHNYRSVTGVPGSTTFQEYASKSGALNLLNMAVGGKFNVKGNFLINANVLFALTNSGVIARLTPVIGFDYTF